MMAGVRIWLLQTAFWVLTVLLGRMSEAVTQRKAEMDVVRQG